MDTCDFPPWYGEARCDGSPDPRRSIRDEKALGANFSPWDERRDEGRPPGPRPWSPDALPVPPLHPHLGWTCSAATPSRRMSMPEPHHTTSGARRRSRGRPLWIATAALAVLALWLWFLVGQGDSPSRPPVATTTTSASTPPPFPSAPYAVTDGASLTVPEKPRVAEGTSWAEAGAQYVVTMDLHSTKPEGSGGRSMYLGVTLSCSPQGGGPGISAGGTQNMLTGEETAYGNQGLISVPEDGGVDCSIKLSAPYDDVASVGTTFPVEATWWVARADGAAEAPTDQVLPTVIAPGEDEEILTVDLAVESPGVDLEALSSLHL